MELFVTRHGETEWNAGGRLCGRTDLPLNETGRAQSGALARELAALQAPIDLVIASPMIRARQTAAILAQALGVPVETDERLIEQHYGEFEGGSSAAPAFLHNKRQFAVRYPGGESMMQVACRVYAFLDELRTREGLRGVLLVSHGGTCRVLNTYFEDIANDDFCQWRMQNAECRRYTL
ncbi:MAG: histidine phosphatase family protein [Clostridiales bacterium]|nr:histidine phosphatase family protein [Clostridiales bacterium]